MATEKKKAAPKKAAAPKVIMVQNNTPYFKVDPDSGARFDSYKPCEVARITGWLEVQIAANLFAIVE